MFFWISEQISLSKAPFTEDLIEVPPLGRIDFVIKMLL